MKSIRHLSWLLLALSLASSPAVAFRNPGPPERPDLDVRLPSSVEGRAGFALRQPSGRQRTLADILRSELPGVVLRWDGMSGAPKWLAAPLGKALSGPRSGSPEDIAREFLSDRAGLYGLDPAEVRRLRVSDVVPVGDGGQHVHFKQTVAGIDVFGSHASVNLSPGGAVMSVGATLYADLTLAVSPSIDPVEAARIATADVYPGLPFSGEVVATTDAPDRKTVFAPQTFGHPPEARLVLFPELAGARLAWEIRIGEKTLITDYLILIDAVDGSVLYRRNLTLYARARVLHGLAPSPETEESDPEQWFLEPIPLETIESPVGWIAGGGTVLEGNNAVSHLRYWTESGLAEPDGAYEYPYNSLSAAAANAWYVANEVHDRFYGLGFDETAGNYQMDNFGRGAAAGDPMHVVAWAGGGRDNAFYSSSVDGGFSTVNFFWTTCRFCGDHDGYPENRGDRNTAFMREVIAHEYAHGVTTRMVGGPSTEDCLWGVQSSAMGEGWSDVFAASFYEDPKTGGHFMEGFGWLRHGVQDLGYEELCDVYDYGCEEHGDGMIWSATLWNLRQSMIALDPAAGRDAFERIAVEALAYTACYPTMLEARDAILSADTMLFDGAHHGPIWNVFAERGMGEGASSPGGENDTAPVVDHAVPLAEQCSAVVAPTGLTATPDGPNGIRLDYTLGPDTRSVEIWRDDLDNFHDRPRRVGFTTDAASYTDGTVQGGKSYRYHLVPMAAGGLPCRGPASATADASATGTCQAYPVFAPNLQIVDGDPGCALTLSWNAAIEGCPGSGDPIVYNVYAASAPGFEPSDVTMIGRTTSTSLQVIPPYDGLAYYFLVLAQHGTLSDAPEHRDRGAAQILDWEPGLATLGRTTAQFWDFEAGPDGWTTDNSADPAGAWTLVFPSPTSYGRTLLAPDEPAGGSGVSWVTGDAGGPSSSVTEHDSDERNLLISPTWDATGGETILSFDYWAHSIGGYFGGILLEIDNGSETVSEGVVGLMTAQPFETDGRHGWQRAEIDLAEYITSTASMSVRFISVSDGNLSEFGIDNVRVESGAACSRPDLEITGVTVDDADPGWGNANGLLEPGETVRLLVEVTNNGTATALSPTGRIVNAMAGTLIHDADDRFPDIPGGESRTSLGEGFTVTLPEEGSCDEALSIEFELTDASNTITRFLQDLEYGRSITEIVLQDDFETDQGWSVSGAGVGQGVWQRVDPVGTLDGVEQAGPEDCADGAATLCYVTESGPETDPNIRDVDDFVPSLASPLLDLSGFKRMRLDFDLWYYESPSSAVWEDYLWYGAETTATDPVGGGTYWFRDDPTGGWIASSVDLTPEMPSIPDVQIIFRAWDGSPDHVVEMGVDNVLVEGDRQSCDGVGVGQPPNGIGDSLRVDRSAADIALSWAASPVDASHDAAAYYELHISQQPGARFSMTDTTTVTQATTTPDVASEYYLITAVNAAGRSTDLPPSSCGNEVREAREACDGPDLGGENCVSHDFDAGSLVCLPGCGGFDTTGCTLCGDGLAEGTEACDGSDLVGESCQTLGWTAGSLACQGGCADFDTSDCSTCGNDLREGSEPCDGTDLGGESCQSLGHQTGTLSCVSTCDAFDESNCSTCGNNIREAAEVCDGSDLAGETCKTQGFDAGTLACAAGCGSFDTSSCRFYQCGNSICEPAAGEDCLSCPSDCNGEQGGNPSGRYCCGDGAGEGPVDCSDPRCTGLGNTCDPS